jgi:hypothetical protein
LIAVVDMTVELGQLLLQITLSNIDVDPEKIDISPVVVHRSYVGVRHKF